MRVSERWRACNAPVGGQMAVERGGCASERRRACNAPVVKPIVVEGGDTCQREVESVQCTLPVAGQIAVGCVTGDAGISSNHLVMRN